MEFLRPSSCRTCIHHRLGDYDAESDYHEHWCDIEENQQPGWFPGMHLDGCVFSAIGMPLCPLYKRIAGLDCDPDMSGAGAEDGAVTDGEAENSKPGILISRDEITWEIKRLAAEIDRDYGGRKPLLLGILKGSFIFLADLVRYLRTPVEIDFVRLSSYGSSRVSCGKVRMVHGLHSSIRGKDVIVVDDIVDTGLAISHLLDYIEKKKPASVKLCALLDKPSRRQTEVFIDYKGIVIPDKFVVGYGMDCNEEYRNLPDICVLEE